jgi:ligand-binding sensor domain-containing protein
VEDRFLFLNTPNADYKHTFIKKNGKWTPSPNPLDTLPWTNIYCNEVDHTLWIGEEREILHMDNHFHILRHYKEGFPGINVLSMLADNYGNIWFVDGRSTISRLNTKTGKFLTLSERDGMQKQKFRWEHAHIKDSYGNLYFGSGEGLYQINPDQFADTYPPSFVYLKTININQKPASLSGGANYVRELYLKHNENNLNIEGGIIDYYSEGNSHIRYKVEGLNKTWQYGTNPFTINFDRLHPGKYKLIMQASNAVDEFNGPEKILLITIRPPGGVLGGSWDSESFAWLYFSMG